MIRDHVRDKSRIFPTEGEPEAFTALRIWHCSYRSLAALERFTNVETLVIASYPDPDLVPLGSLRHLRHLRILHLPQVTDLAPIAELAELRVVRLETLPSWDSSGKVTTVASLQPLAALPHLTHLQLFGVRPPSRSLADLETSGSLRSLRVTKFPRAEVRRFREATGINDAWAPPPDVEDWP